MTTAVHALDLLRQLGYGPSNESRAALTAILTSLAARVSDPPRTQIVDSTVRRLLDGGSARAIDDLQTNPDAERLLVELLQASLTASLEASMTLAEALAEVGCATGRWELDVVRQVAATRVVSTLRRLGMAYPLRFRDDFVGAVAKRLVAPACRARGARPTTEAGAMAFLRVALKREFLTSITRESPDGPVSVEDVPGGSTPAWKPGERLQDAVAHLREWASDEIASAAGRVAGDLVDILAIAEGEETTTSIAARDGVTVNAIHQRHTRVRKEVFAAIRKRLAPGRYSDDQVEALHDVLEDLRGRGRKRG